MTPDEVARFRREIVEYGALTGGSELVPRDVPFVDRSVVGRKVTVPTTLVWSDRATRALTRRGAELTRRYVDAAPTASRCSQASRHWIPTQEPARLARIVLDRIASEVPS